MASETVNGNRPATVLLPESGTGQPSASDLIVVGIGASAGGLEALRQLLRSLNVPSGMAIVLLQHHSPDYESALSYVVQELSSAAVVEIADQTSLEGGHVYVAPPDCIVVLRGGQFHLQPFPSDAARFSPIDALFSSLAEEAGVNAVAIVLSGTGADGAKGIHAIKAAGGVVMVQHPESAKNADMPKAAMVTGKCDLVLTPSEIAEELQLLALRRGQRAVIPERLEDALVIRPQQFEKIFSLLRDACGINFGQYKLPTLQRRIRRRMAMHKVVSVEHYLAFLQDNPQEVAKLHQDILIHVTRFFREPESFEALAQKVFSELVKPRPLDDPVRIWVPGCSTGEEPYSIAIALFEFLHAHNLSVPVEIYATDVSENALSRARAGVYPATIADEISSNRLQHFFTRVDGQYRINKAFRDMCEFAQQDLTRDAPLAKPDLIVCRNVLIYFSLAVQSRLLHVFHYALKPDGFLMLGSAESIGQQINLFELIDKRSRIYRKKRTESAIDGHYTLPMHRQQQPMVQKEPTPQTSLATVDAETTRLLLERYSPAAVVVDEEMRIVRFRGRTETFLKAKPGEATPDLFRSCREGMLPGLRSTLQKARKTSEAAYRQGLRIQSPEGAIEADLDVLPFSATGAGRHFLIVFHTAAAPTSSHAIRKAKWKQAPSTLQEAEQIVQRLQAELSASREYMQSIIQDLEAVNGELQSANQEIHLSNEEVRSANEELDATKEELQTTNEQLNAVNEELHSRNEELVRINTDLMNVLNSMPMAIVILDRNGKVTRFTPLAELVLNLLPGDIGRPIRQMKLNMDCPELDSLIANVMHGETVPSCEVQDTQGRQFVLTLHPYTTMDNRIDGVVLSLLPTSTVRES